MSLGDSLTPVQQQLGYLLLILPRGLPYGLGVDPLRAVASVHPVLCISPSFFFCAGSESPRQMATSLVLAPLSLRMYGRGQGLPSRLVVCPTNHGLATLAFGERKMASRPQVALLVTGEEVGQGLGESRAFALADGLHRQRRRFL